MILELLKTGFNGGRQCQASVGRGNGWGSKVSMERAGLSRGMGGGVSSTGDQ